MIVNNEKYELMKPGEKEMMNFLFIEGFGVAETKKKLRELGIEKETKDILRFKKKAIANIIESDRAEYLSDYLLDSTRRAKIEFNDIMDKTKKLLDSAEDDGKQLFQLDILKELRAQVELALKSQGQMNSTIKQSIVNIQNNHLTNSDIIGQMEKIKIGWLKDGGAIITKDNMILFESPTAEMIDILKKLKFSQEFGRSKVFDVESE